MALSENRISLQRRDELRRQGPAEVEEALSAADVEEAHEAGLPAGALDAWPHSGAVTCAAWDGAANSVSLRASAPLASRAWERTIGAILFVLVACGLAWGFRRAHESEWLARFAPLALVLGGIAWWVWLQPGVAGPVIAAAGVWLSFGRPNRRGYHFQHTS